VQKPGATFLLLLLICLLSSVLTAGAAHGSDVSPPSHRCSGEELDSLLAPVALYPDSLLSQLLMAATYPLDVVAENQWLQQNPGLEGNALDGALEGKDWDMSVKSLAFFPQVLTMMDDKLDWTTRVGDAFVNQEDDVLDAIQRLRSKARAAGNLETNPEQKITSQESKIRIEPVDSQVVYVPVYNPVVIYGPWWIPAHPPYVVVPNGYVAGPWGIAFTDGYFAGSVLYGGFDWWGGEVVIQDNGFVRKHDKHDRHHEVNRVWRHDADHARAARENAARRASGKSAGLEAGRADRASGAGDLSRDFRGYDRSSQKSDLIRAGASTEHGSREPGESRAFDAREAGPDARESSARGAQSRWSMGFSESRDFSRGMGGGAFGGGGFSHGGGGGRRR